MHTNKFICTYSQLIIIFLLLSAIATFGKAIKMATRLHSATVRTVFAKFWVALLCLRFKIFFKSSWQFCFISLLTSQHFVTPPINSALLNKVNYISRRSCTRNEELTTSVVCWVTCVHYVLTSRALWRALKSDCSALISGAFCLSTSGCRRLLLKKVFNRKGEGDTSCAYCFMGGGSA